MSTHNQDTQFSFLLWTRSSTIACSMFAVLALAVLCSTPSTAQCVVGTNAALNFDGMDDGVVCPQPGAGVLSGANDFTVECWISAQPVGNVAFRFLVGSFGTFTGQSWTLGLKDGRPSLWLNGSERFAPVTSAADLRDGNWHHIAINRSSGTINTFVDGILLPSAPTYAAPLASSAAPLTIGRRSETPSSQWFNGAVDEVRIWGVHRIQAQIQTAMNLGLSGNEPGLVGYWRFDEGSGQTVFNSAVATGSALDGTLGSNALPGTDDPTWISTGLPPLPYCPPCPTPPCGQVNSPCATLTVNGVGAAAQGPFNVVVPPGGPLTFDWFGPVGAPYVLISTTNLIPGQVVAPPTFVVDVNIGAFQILYGAFDPVWGPLFFTNASGTGTQTFGLPSIPLGITMNVQGLIYDLANTCSGGVGLATTASFSIQL